MTRLSPSSTAMIRGGSPTRRPMAVAATASVGLTTAPSAVASAKEMLGKIQWTTAPITSAETITITTESQVIRKRLRRTSMTGRLTAEEYSSGGSTPARISSGSMWIAGAPGR